MTESPPKDQNQSPSPMNVERRLFSSEMIDLGTRKATVVGATPMSLPIRNFSDEPVRILQVEQSCGCLKVKLSKIELGPNESTDIRFILSLTKPGRQSATIRLQCASLSGYQWIEAVQIDWEVAAVLTVSPDIIFVNDHPARSRFEAKFSFLSDEPMTDLHVEAEPGVLKLLSGNLNIDAVNRHVIVEGTVPEEDHELVLSIIFRNHDLLLSKAKVVVRPWKPVRFSPGEIYLSLPGSGQPIRRRCVVAIDPSAVKWDELTFGYLPDEAQSGVTVTIKETQRREQVLDLEIEFRPSPLRSERETGRLVAKYQDEVIAYVPIRMRANPAK